MKPKLFLVFALLVFLLHAHAQVVISDSTSTPALDSCAIFEVTSTSKGILIPRLTLAQRSVIPSPKASLLIYNSDERCFNYFDGADWLSLVGSMRSASVPIVRTYTTDSTWTKPIGLKYIIVEMVGGGGGGGGCGSYGGGAGAGAGYCKKIIRSVNLTPIETILIGAGGEGGPAETKGENGGTTFFGNHCSATGGQGGSEQISYVYSTSVGSLGGVGIGGDINFCGQASGGATSAAAPLYCGGSSFFGGGAPPNASNSEADGINATGYGSGGGGSNGYRAGYKKGGNGSSGMVIITEYY